MKIIQFKSPKYKIGEVVCVKYKVEDEVQTVLQGIIFSAEFRAEWFYGIELRNPMKPLDEPERVYSYEEDTGDAKTEIIDLSSLDKPLTANK